MKYRVDASAVTFLGLCLEPGCECIRFLASSRSEAVQMLAGHESRVHPRSKTARAARSRRRESQPLMPTSSRGVVA